MNRLSILSAGLLLAAGAVGQNTAIFPSAATAQNGAGSENRFPFSNGISRTMGVYEAWDLNVPNGASITSIGFRQDEARSSSAAAIQVEIYMGPSDLDAGTLSRTFDDNYTPGTTPLRVFGPAIVNLPALNIGGTQNIDITLDTPYVFDASKNLAVEFRISANNNGNASFNYYVDRSTFFSANGTAGAGCASSSGNIPVLTLQPAFIGGSISAQLTNAPANSFIYLNLATAPTTPLPGAGFGAPGCTLYVIPETVFAIQQGSSGGSASFSIPVPLDLNLYQLDVFGQCLITDLFANQLGWIGSNAATVQLGARGAMGIVSGQGSTTLTTGSRRTYHGVVTRFGYQ